MNGLTDTLQTACHPHEMPGKRGHGLLRIMQSMAFLTPVGAEHCVLVGAAELSTRRTRTSFSIINRTTSQ